jgi:hypothetical protein
VKELAVAKAKVFPHLKARLHVGREIPHFKDSLSLLMVQYSKDTCVKKTPEYVHGQQLASGAPAPLKITSVF